jgi:hypothetical protein
MENHGLRVQAIKILFALLIVLGSLAAVSHPASGLQIPVPGLTAQSQQQTTANLLAQADEVLQKMSRITGLPIKSPVHKKIVSREEVQKILLHNLHTEYTPQEIHVQEGTLRAFGLIPKDFDFQKFIINFYTEQVAGFYDPRTKTMYMADWIPPEMQGMVLSHELTHALQDQNFNLVRYMKAVKNKDDAEAARQAVVEGYATAAMFQTVLGDTPISAMPNFGAVLGPLMRQQMTEFPIFSKAPFFFKLQALFPYIQGASFIATGLRQKDWQGLNELFTSPPSSTKAIFQPEVYFNQAALPEVKLPGKTPLSSVPGLKQLDESTMGELGCSELVGQFLSEEKAAADCTGWMGDRYVVYENPATQSYALLARTRWANADSALTFFRDYHSILGKKYPGFSPDSHSDAERIFGRTASGNVILLYAGDEVRWAEGIPASKVGATLRWLEAL